MGVYIEAFIDNGLFEINLDFTVKKLCQLLKKELYLIGDFNENKYPEKMNNYLFVEVYNKEDIKKGLYSDKYLNIYIKDENYKLDISMSKSSIQFYGFGWKWYVFEDYLLGNNKIFDDKINEIIHFGKLFNSTEMIIFGDDYYEIEIEDKLLEGEYINEIIQNKEFNIVSNIPINKDDEIHIYYKKLYPNKIFDYNNWITYFPFIKNEE